MKRTLMRLGASISKYVKLGFVYARANIDSYVDLFQYHAICEDKRSRRYVEHYKRETPTTVRQSNNGGC